MSTTEGSLGLYAEYLKLISGKAPPKPLHLRLFEDVTSRLNHACAEAIPNAQKKVTQDIEASYQQFSEQINSDNVEAVISLVCDRIRDQVSGYVKDNVGQWIQVVEMIKDEAAKKARVVHDLSQQHLSAEDLLEVEERLPGYTEQYRLIMRFSKYFSQKKKKIKIAILGNTQTGKTKFITNLFQLKPKTLEKHASDSLNLKSSTTNVVEYSYTRNGVEITMIDTPGHQSTQGKEQELSNVKLILDYLESNDDIDLIFWVAKLESVIDLETSNLLNKYTKLYGSDIWKKCLVILTHANCTRIPDEYYEHLSEDDDSEFSEEPADHRASELVAWQTYTQAKIKQWKLKFSELEHPTVPVCLVENSLRYTQSIDGVRVLVDQTPILEPLLIQTFKTIKKDKAAILFLSISEEEPDEKKSKEHQIALSGIINSQGKPLSHLVWESIGSSS